MFPWRSDIWTWGKGRQRKVLLYRSERDLRVNILGRENSLRVEIQIEHEERWHVDGDRGHTTDGYIGHNTNLDLYPENNGKSLESMKQVESNKSRAAKQCNIYYFWTSGGHTDISQVKWHDITQDYLRGAYFFKSILTRMLKITGLFFFFKSIFEIVHDLLNL